MVFLKMPILYKFMYTYMYIHTFMFISNMKVLSMIIFMLDLEANYMLSLYSQSIVEMGLKSTFIT